MHCGHYDWATKICLKRGKQVTPHKCKDCMAPPNAPRCGNCAHFRWNTKNQGDCTILDKGVRPSSLCRSKGEDFIRTGSWIEPHPSDWIPPDAEG